MDRLHARRRPGAARAFRAASPNPAQFCNDNQLGIIGTPDDAIREIERIRNTLGGFGAVLVFGNDLAPWPAQLRSFELLAEFVKPHFSRVNALRRASYDWTAGRPGGEPPEGARRRRRGDRGVPAQERRKRRLRAAGRRSYWITSAALATRVSGTESPSVVAV